MFYPRFLAVNFSFVLKVQLHLRSNTGFVVHFYQVDIRIVLEAFHRSGSHFNLFHQFQLVSIHRIELIHHVVRRAVCGRITQTAERIERSDSFFRFVGIIHTLRFVDNHYRVGFFYQVDGFVAQLIVVAVDNVRFVVFIVVLKTFAESIDVNYHNLDAISRGKRAYLFQFGSIVHKIIVHHILVFAFEVFFGDLQRFVCSLFDGDARHYNDKFGKAVTFVQFKYSFQIDIGFTCTSLHFYREVHSLFLETLGRRLRHAVAQLDTLHIGKHILLDHLYGVSDTDGRTLK